MINFTKYKKRLWTYLPFHLYFVSAFLFVDDQIYWKVFGRYIEIPAFPHVAISWIPTSWYDVVIRVNAALLFLSLATLIINPWIRSARILSLITWILLFAYESSFGKTFNHHYPLTFSLLVMIFFPDPDKNPKSFKELLIVAKFNVLMCYAMAGLWKIRFLPQLIREGEFGWNLGNVIAFEHLKYTYEMSSISQWFMERESILGVLFASSIILQTFSPIFIIRQWSQVLIGLSLMLFHVGSKYILHIDFSEVTILLFVLFVIEPSWDVLRSIFSKSKLFT